MKKIVKNTKTIDRTKKKFNPLVSVIIPCYNQGSYIRETLDSVASQTYPRIDIIVVNDGSTDPTTLQILRNLRDKNLKVFHTTNKGPSAARNFGINRSRGKYILPLDADDLIHPEYIKTAVSILESNNEIDVVYAMGEIFGEKNGSWDLPDFNAKEMLIGNHVYCSAVFRRKDFHLVRGYNTEMKLGWEDWDFWLTFLEHKKKFYRIPQVMFYYRIKSGSRNDRTNHPEIRKALYAQLVRNHPKLYSSYAEDLAIDYFSLRDEHANLLNDYRRLTSSRIMRLAKRVDNLIHHKRLRWLLRTARIVTNVLRFLWTKVKALHHRPNQSLEK
jgi:glycosyltransferase involved in cell wall biosynthesis